MGEPLSGDRGDIPPPKDTPIISHFVERSTQNYRVKPKAKALGMLLGRVDICKTFGNRRGEVPSPIDQRGLEPPNYTTVESIVGLYSYLDTKTSILENRPTAVRNRL